MKEEEFYPLFRKRYKGWNMQAPRFVHCSHPALSISGGVEGNKNRIIDYLVLDRNSTFHHTAVVENSFKREGLYLKYIHAFEIKVSTSDLIKELKSPDKAEAWSQYSTHFWLVVPSMDIVNNLPEKYKIPDSWGILVMSKNKESLRSHRSPVVNMHPKDIPAHTVANIVYSSMRTRQPIKRTILEKHDGLREWD